MSTPYIVASILTYLLTSYLTAVMLRKLGMCGSDDSEVGMYLFCLFSPISFPFVFMAFLCNYLTRNVRRN